jgi:hypothetical protein
MTPEAALETQIERYRQMTGEERLLEGFRLTEAEHENQRAEIRRQYPSYSEGEVEGRFHQLRRIANQLHPT